jgi:hypothetical protein
VADERTKGSDLNRCKHYPDLICSLLSHYSNTDLLLWLRNILCHIFKAPNILVPAGGHSYFVASWWRTPLRHSPRVTRFYFQQILVIHAPVGKIKGCSLSGRSPAPIADSFHVAKMARKQSALNLREITRNNKHIALASVVTYYGWVSLNFSFFVVTQRNII